MQRLLSVLIIVAMLIGATCAEAAGAAYRLGDSVQDFTFTLADGTEVSLYETLREKDAVLINFMASWCYYCTQELPHLDAAYRQTRDRIAVFALSGDPSDTPDLLGELWQDLGIEAIPYGIDTNGIAQMFGVTGFPHNVLIDRNGVLCFSTAGYNPAWGADELIRLMNVYAASDYREPMLLEDMPAPEWGDVNLLSAAILQGDLHLILPDDPGVWPFEITDDDTGIQPTNNAAQQTAAFSVQTNANAGEALAYDLSMNCATGIRLLSVSVDGTPAKTHTGSMARHTEYVPFFTDGEHTVTFEFYCHLPGKDEDAPAMRLSNIRKIDCPDAEIDPAAGGDPRIEPLRGAMRPANLHVDYYGVQVSFPMAIMQSEVSALRIALGGIDADTAFITSGSSILALQPLSCDGDAFILPLSMLFHADGIGFDFNLYANLPAFTDPSIGAAEGFILCESEAEADGYAAYAQRLYDAQTGLPNIVRVSWAYADAAPDEMIDPNAPCIVYVRDAIGNPVPDVVLQFCDDSTCVPGTTDANGACEQRINAACEVHVYRTPDGYTTPDETYMLPENGATLTITLQNG